MNSIWENPMSSWRSRIFALALMAGAALPAWSQNVIQSINSSQQAGAEVIRIELSEALTAVPAGFTVQAPPRVAIDLPGVTNVKTTAAESWAARAGVCQDIAHVTVGALRAAGIPARYVSGYLHPKPSAELRETVTGESHAWVEFFCGTWHGYDPTNLIDIGERHVVVGQGRDYRDVPPLRGVYAGSSNSELFVTVEITREA